MRCATVTTMHGRLDLRDLEALYREYADVPLVSISDAQREPMPWANWRATVYHGLPDDLYRFHPEPGGYLCFLGRICPEKRVDRAIAIAKRAGFELKIAAKVDAADEEYFETEIRHLLDDPLVDFIGEIGDGEKEAFLGGAAALLMPIDWPEPFGLVVIESMACGTPVIAFPFGSMPELIEPGVNGALVESVGDAVAAVEALAALDRTLCRRSFEQRFTTTRMARNYITVYEGLVEEVVSSPGSIRAARARYPDPGSCARGGRGAGASRVAQPSRRQGVTAAIAEAPVSKGALSTGFVTNPHRPGDHRALRDEGQSTSSHLPYPGSARGTDALRVTLPPKVGIQVGRALALDLCVEQAQLAFERGAALFRRALEQILKAGAQPSRHLNRGSGVFADLLERQAHVVVPRNDLGHESHRTGLVAVFAARKPAMHEVAQKVVETVDGLHRRGRVERLGEAAHADVDQ